MFVFKTLADPFAGRITYFKVMSGVLKNDATLQNFNRNSQERLQHIQVMQGKTATGGPNDLHAGDIGAIAKLKETTTGETLGDKNAPDLLRRRRGFPSLPSPLRSNRKRARTKTASARPSTKFWKRIWRCASAAIRRPRNFCSAARGSSTSKWWWRNCASAITWN